MRALWSTSRTQPRGSLMSNDDVAAYNAKLDPQRAAITDRLRAIIDAQLPPAKGKAAPVAPTSRKAKAKKKAPVKAKARVRTKVKAKVKTKAKSKSKAKAKSTSKPKKRAKARKPRAKK